MPFFQCDVCLKSAICRNSAKGKSSIDEEELMIHPFFVQITGEMQINQWLKKLEICYDSKYVDSDRIFMHRFFTVLFQSIAMNRMDVKTDFLHYPWMLAKYSEICGLVWRNISKSWIVTFQRVFFYLFSLFCSSKGLIIFIFVFIIFVICWLF